VVWLSGCGFLEGFEHPAIPLGGEVMQRHVGEGQGIQGDNPPSVEDGTRGEFGKCGCDAGAKAEWAADGEGLFAEVADGEPALGWYGAFHDLDGIPLGCGGKSDSVHGSGRVMEEHPSIGEKGSTGVVA
jgi:hypothetical protein